MATVEEANKLIKDIELANQKITQISIHVQEKEKIINQLLASVQVSSLDELNAKIAACQQQLDNFYAIAKQTLDETEPKIVEAEICLQN